MINRNIKFINREISWLEFNARVLDEAADSGVPLLERLKFLAIFSSNLDEFFMVRVAGVRRQMDSKANPGYDPAELLEAIEKRTRTLVARQYRYLREDILPKLETQGIKIASYSELSQIQRKMLEKYFINEIQPVLTPIGVDQLHPFPLIRNGGLEILIRLKKKDDKQERYAIVEVPSLIPRFISVENREGIHLFIKAEELIAENLHTLLQGCDIYEASTFRITRDMDFYFDEDSVADLLSELRSELRKRAKRKAIRLEISKNMTAKSKNWLMKNLDISSNLIYQINGFLDLKGLFSLLGNVQMPELKEKDIPPLPSIHIEEDESIFDAIKRNGDFLLHHPYESFKPVIQFLNEAANDPDVLAIKQTLYRVSGDSPVVKALIRAAQNGKQVTVLIELKARFDEENNIVWARELAEAGAHVVYGIAGLKVHCKALLVVRKEASGIRRYVHLSTGNYNDSTARLYTDIGMFSDEKLLTSDISALFNVITGFSDPPKWNKVMVAPFSLREKMIFLIEREIKVSTKENPGRIIIKANSVIDDEIMEYIYKAAENNVKIDLIVRGICGLNPFRKPELKKNINIISILDRFLEHPRIYYFKNNGSNEYYIGSADMMPRNLDRRIEVLFPVDRDNLKEELGIIIKYALNDKRKGRKLSGPNKYSRTIKAQRFEKSRSQAGLYDYYRKRYRNSVSKPGDGELKIFREPE